MGNRLIGKGEQVGGEDGFPVFGDGDEFACVLLFQCLDVSGDVSIPRLELRPWICTTRTIATNIDPVSAAAAEPMIT